MILFALLFILPLISYSMGNGLIEFDVPDQLEIQSDSLMDMNDNFKELSGIPSADGSMKVTLQQKGYNDLTSEGLSRYCI